MPFNALFETSAMMVVQMCGVKAENSSSEPWNWTYENIVPSQWSPPPRMFRRQRKNNTAVAPNSIVQNYSHAAEFKVENTALAHENARNRFNHCPLSDEAEEH